MDKEVFICERLRKLGYARDLQVRLYGEELHLVSNPVPDGAGFSVEGVVIRSGKLRRVRIPLTVVDMTAQEGALPEELELAA
jgi:hypothetical protein